MIIDMHNHTNVSSPCSVLYPEELIETAKSLGLDGICVTDHNSIEGANLAREIGLQMDFPVFRGLEVTSELGDMLVFGYYADVSQGISFEDLCEIVHGSGGVLFAAHPFFLRGGWNLYSAMKKSSRIDLEFDWRKAKIVQKLDGLETRNGSVNHLANQKAEMLANRLNKHGIGGSDAHCLDMIAKAATRFPRKIHNEEELVAALKSGKFEAVYFS